MTSAHGFACGMHGVPHWAHLDTFKRRCVAFGFVASLFIQRSAVALPPVLGLLAVVIFGLLFGVLGVLLATPMMVVLMILMETLHIDAPKAAAD